MNIRYNILMRGLCFVLSFTLLAISSGWTEVEPDNIDIEQKIKDLRISFMGIWTGNISDIETSIFEKQKEITEILGYAKNNPDNWSQCYYTVRGMLEQYINTFKPSADIDREIVKKMLNRISIQENPQQGVSVLTHLLLELANMKQNPDILHDALDIAFETYRASCFLVLSMIRELNYEPPSTIDEKIERMIRGELIDNHSTVSFEIVWCCECYLSKIAESKPSWIPMKSLDESENFIKWKLEKDLLWLIHTKPNQIMMHLKKFAESLIIK